MIYITGDTHGEFDRLIRFCSRFQTTREDMMIILLRVDQEAGTDAVAFHLFTA